MKSREPLSVGALFIAKQPDNTGASNNARTQKIVVCKTFITPLHSIKVLQKSAVTNICTFGPRFNLFFKANSVPRSKYTKR